MTTLTMLVMIPSEPNRDTSPLKFVTTIKAMVIGNATLRPLVLGGLNF